MAIPYYIITDSILSKFSEHLILMPLKNIAKIPYSEIGHSQR
jgi:hypothetical protein